MLPKSFDLSRETAIYEAWERAGAFRAGAGAAEGAETFSVMIPPPNVTGNLHMGHAFNNTLQDILVRWHRMRGHDTLWQPGTDHAGIATQMVVERELAKEGKPPRRDMKRDDFLKLVWEQKSKSRGNIIGQLKRLGASCDWEREAFTMGGAPGDPERELGGGQNFHDAVIRVFVDMYEKGLIYRGKRLVNWDPHFETAISDLEVENIEVPGHMWHFKYPLAGGATYTYEETDEDGTVLFTEERDYISIATTRPETMLGDGAVAVHPSDSRYAPLIGQLCEIPVGPKETRRLIPIITDDYPDPDFGSGAVKITGAHDFNDYGVAQRNGIPLYRLMDNKGVMRTDGLGYDKAAVIAEKIASRPRGQTLHDFCYSEGVLDSYKGLSPETATQSAIDLVNLVPEDLRGLDRYEARKRVVEQITSEGLAVMTMSTDPRLGGSVTAPVAPEEGGEDRTEELVPLVEAKPIVQPHGDRSKTVIEPMLTDQWFVDAEKIVGPAIEEVRRGMARPEGSTEGTRILPEQDAKVYFHWLENIEPWTISRQLWWGHRIPVWYGYSKEFLDENRGPGAKDIIPLKEFCAPSEDAAKALAQKYYGDEVEITVQLPGPLIRLYSRSGQLQNVSIFRDPDVLDTWFSSGLWPIGTLGWIGNPEEDAANEALRKYFPTSVLVTGFDIIFFWVARMMMMQLAVVDQKPFDTVYVHALVRDEKGKKMSKSLGNVIDPLDLVDEYGADAVRFTLAAMAAMGRDLKLSTARVAGYRNFGNKLWNAAKFAQMNEAWSAAPAEPTLAVNKWIVAEADRAAREAQAALEGFRFNEAANGLYAFTWNTLCDWYLELSKPLLMGEDEAAKAETQATLARVMDTTLTLLHPFMPFVTEEIWQNTAKRSDMLCLTRWPEPSETREESGEVPWLIALIEAIRSSRGEMGVPAGAKLPLLIAELEDEQRGWLRANLPLLQRLARVTELQDAPELPKGAASVPVPGGLLAIPLAGVIDVAAETARLTKTRGKLEKELGGLRGRLKNPKFADSAPPEVVEETRANLALREEEAAKIDAALTRLGEME